MPFCTYDAQCLDMQNAKDADIYWLVECREKCQKSVTRRSHVHPLKQPGENQPFFHFNRFIFASYFLFSRNIQFWTFTQHKIRNLVFILSHYSYAELAAFSICANDVFHISVYLAKIYLECVQRREMDSQKLIQKLITTQLDAIKKFASAISSLRLVNSMCMHIVKDIWSGGHERSK